MGETEAESLETLLARVALGDRAAFESLYRSTAGRLFAICRRVLGDAAEAEEVLQEVYTRVWRKAEQFDASRAGAMSWLGMMARNRAIDRLRTLPARSLRADAALAERLSDPSASPMQSAETLSDRERLERCIDALEPKRRDLIRQAFFGGLTYEDLAARSAAPLGTIKSWIRRGLLQLRECVGQ